ncbi:hypothetical protein BVC80_8961g8 [Macleaya cordata]|uniref:Proton pump-interactor n=1 Tax=Macleaya cordata TaxID=56857 RepID=A0A200QBA6_MACCD|nr:hypothetical protein BVC80_8961g8 [Macleaya cordata]
MGVEVMGGDLTQVPVKDVIEGDNTFVHEKENGKLNQGPVVDEPIKFGSHGIDVPVKQEVAPVKDTNLPKDAVDEWPAPKQIHSFYFVKFRPYDDPKLKVKIDQADKELHRKNQARFQMTEAIKAKRAERANVISQLKPLTGEDKKYRMIVDEKRKEMEPLHQALGKLRNANNANREKGVGLCSSEEELNDLIHSLNYRIQHESNTLVEEKQLLREIKQLEGSRDKVIANAAVKAKIQDSLGQKEAIQDQVKLIGGDLDGVRKEQQAIRAKIRNLEEELKAIDNDISTLQEDLTALSQTRDKAFENLVELRKQREGGNAYFYQNRSLLNNARELAAKKDIAALEELSNAEVEKFMSQWSSSKAFRDDYEKRILTSLDQRQLSRDGRMRNPDEKPLVSEAPPPSEPETVVKPNIKRPKEDTKPLPQQEKIPISKVQKEENKKSTVPETSAKADDLEDKENISVLAKPQKEPAKVIDEAKLKEMKREEEIAKARMALERKRKLADKAAAKAAVRAQKEAEKKLKESNILEREKRSKKKAVGSGVGPDSEEQTEADNSESVEPETANVTVEAPVPSKNKELKENTIRSRNRPRGGQDSLPKAILKRKKSTSYWQWAAPAALVILILVVLGYYYLL